MIARVLTCQSDNDTVVVSVMYIDNTNPLAGVEIETKQFRFSHEIINMQARTEIISYGKKLETSTRERDRLLGFLAAGQEFPV